MQYLYNGIKIFCTSFMQCYTDPLIFPCKPLVLVQFENPCSGVGLPSISRLKVVGELQKKIKTLQELVNLHSDRLFVAGPCGIMLIRKTKVKDTQPQT